MKVVIFSYWMLADFEEWSWRNVPDTGLEPGSPALQADSLPAKPPGKLNQNFPKSQKDPKQELNNRCC